MKNELTDLTYLREASANNSLFIKEMVLLFLKQTPEFLEKIQQSLQNGDRAEAAKVLHKLKPCVKMMGIESLEAHIKKMEQDVKSGNELPDIEADYTFLEKMCKDAYSELQMQLLKL